MTTYLRIFILASAIAGTVPGRSVRDQVSMVKAGLVSELGMFRAQLFGIITECRSDSLRERAFSSAGIPTAKLRLT
jgi:hypothetical protein